MYAQTELTFGSCAKGDLDKGGGFALPPLYPPWCASLSINVEPFMLQSRTNAAAARRTRRLIVRTTDEEQTRIRQRADEASLSVSEYARRMLIEGRIEVRRESGYSLSVAHQLRRIGVNINQQMAIAHLDGELPPALVRLWSKLETLLDRMLRRTNAEGDADPS